MDQGKKSRNGRGIKARLAAKFAARQPQPAPSPPPPPSTPRTVKVTSIEGGTPDERATRAIEMMREMATARANGQDTDDDDGSTVVTHSITSRVESTTTNGQFFRMMNMDERKDPDAQAKWLRGFCTTLGTHVFTHSEALLTACTAFGRSPFADPKHNTMEAPNTILDNCLKVIAEEGPDVSPYMLEAVGRLLSDLTGSDILIMNEKTAWKFCEVAMIFTGPIAHPACQIPVHLAPLAMRWVSRTWATKQYAMHMKAASMTGRFFARHGHPLEAAHFLNKAIFCGQSQGIGKTSDHASEAAMCMKYLGDAGQDDRSLEMCLSAIASQTDAEPFPASLLLDLHGGAAALYARMDRYDSMYAHLVAMRGVLERTEPPFDDTPDVLVHEKALVAFKTATVLCHMKCFDEALQEIGRVAPAHRHTVFLNTVTPDQLEATMRSYLDKNRDTVPSDCAWRMCRTCGLIAKDMLHCACTTAWYCGTECQNAHWRQHWLTCACCWVCEKVGFDFSLCGGCAGVRYCSVECSVADWPRHKPNCTWVEPPDVDPCDEMQCELLDPVEHADIVADMLGDMLGDNTGTFLGAVMHAMTGRAEAEAEK